MPATSQTGQQGSRRQPLPEKLIAALLLRAAQCQVTEDFPAAPSNSETGRAWAGVAKKRLSGHAENHNLKVRLQMQRNGSS
jgi:hypothetical protein